MKVQRKRVLYGMAVLALSLLFTAGGAVQASAKVSRAKALSIALKDAGVKQSAASKLKAVKDKERGVSVYEISFRSNGYKYEYDVRVQDGKIISEEKEILKKKVGSGSRISASKARKLILKHAKAQTGKSLKGVGLSLEYDKEHGVPVYEGEFREKGISFEYEIHARNGAILEYNIEWPAR